MNDNIKSSQVIFFLGAGASKAADVPDTYSFVKEFIDSLRETDKKETIEKVVSVLKEWKKGKDIDIELLLETLTKLENKKDEPLLEFYDKKEFILEKYSAKKPLIDDLKDFIKSKAIVSEDKIQYLQPFLAFIEDRPLDIISVNYDTCMEQFSNVHKLEYQDGFDVHWNPKTFTKEHTDIRLYKLHGSVMWYQSDRGGYIKLPVMAGKSRIQLITGERAENLMLYPMQKWDYAEPLLELLVHIKHLLESETCRFLIVVGYSFRDEHITRIIWDSARKNKELHIILIDPNAYQIYSEKLKYYDTHRKNPSSLDGKVVCLPYKFEEVFPYLKNHYLKNLSQGLSTDANMHQKEINGEKIQWIGAIKPFVGAEHIEKLETLISKIDTIEIERNWELSLELPLKMAVNLSANDQKERANNYFKEFDKRLYNLAVDGIYPDISGGMHREWWIKFRYKTYDTGGNFDAKQFEKSIESLLEFCENRMEFANHVGNEFQKTKEKLKKLETYLETFKEGEVKLEDYINYRENKISNVQEFREEYKKYLEKSSQEQYEHLATTVVETEKSILEEILKD